VVRPSMAMAGGGDAALIALRGAIIWERKRKEEKMRGDGRGLITPLNADLKEGKPRGAGIRPAAAA
jgi:hypothetical protein